jgi:hypothetical protein
MSKILSFLFFLAAMNSLTGAITATKLYFTTDMQSGGTSIQPGHAFNYIWNAMGNGKNGKVYTAVGNNNETQGGGDVCIVEYDPYANTMKSCGTVVQAFQQNGNWITGETCNKVHSWLCGTPDGKVWFSTVSGGRGGHVLYIDTKRNDTIIDYSRTARFHYLSPNYTTPVPNNPLQPPSLTNGQAIWGNDLQTMNLNPYCPGYVWTWCLDTVYAFQLWNVPSDTTRSWTGGDASLRVFLVDKQGSMYYQSASTITKRTVLGQARSAGTGLLGADPSAFVYSHSFETAYTTERGEGFIQMFDFIGAKATTLADLPGTGTSNQEYRAITISKNGQFLYILGNSGNIYELTIATKQYKVIGNISGSLAGSYATSSGVMDTLGNWYMACFGNGGAYLLKVKMGADTIRALHIPDSSETTAETGIPVSLNGSAIKANPNPFNGATQIVLSHHLLGRGPVSLKIYDLNGGMVEDFGELSGRESSQTVVRWSAVNRAPGIYLARAKMADRTYSLRMTLMR